MKKRLMDNLGLKILAFLIAAFMWLIVVNIDNPVTDKTFSGIPVTVMNEEIVTDNNRTYQIIDNTQEVSVTVTAKRSVLNNIKADDIMAVADMKELTLGTQVPIEVTIPGYKYERPIRRRGICKYRSMTRQRIISRSLQLPPARYGKDIW